MMIIFEGIDNTGKSTLAEKVALALGDLPIQQSEGPPKYPGEMNIRLQRYDLLPSYTIFDRHPIVSQTIYGQMRSHEDQFDQTWIKRVLDKKPFFIYCHPTPERRGMQGHRARHTVDTRLHLSSVEEHYNMLLDLYTRWALLNAHWFYRIGDDESRLISCLKHLSSNN